jgi:hypothetical protein
MLSNWISFLVYPNLFEIKGFVVVIIVVVVLWVDMGEVVLSLGTKLAVWLRRPYIFSLFFSVFF